MGKPTADSLGAASQKAARLVWNHSTHLSGLIPILNVFVSKSYPNRNAGSDWAGKRSLPENATTCLSPIRGGYKVIARQGKTVQEVFILTPLAQSELETALAIPMKS